MLRRRVVPVLFALMCLGAPALLAQQQSGASAPPPLPADSAAPLSGPRIQPAYQRYQPALERERGTAAAAADRTTITITTLGLVLLIVLLVILIA